MREYVKSPPADAADAAVAAGVDWAVARRYWNSGDDEMAARHYAAAARHYAAAGMDRAALDASDCAEACRRRAETRAAWDYARNYGPE